jgi:uncharacterized protein (DUF2126 family)
MAKLGLCLNWEDVTLSVNAWKTVGAIKAGSDQQIAIERVRLATGGVAGDAIPLEVRLQPVTAASGTGTSATPSKRNRSNGTTARSTARVNFSAEPTSTANSHIGQDKFHPQGGEFQDFTFGDVVSAAAEEWAIQVKVPSGQTAVTCSGHCFYEE